MDFDSVGLGVLRYLPRTLIPAVLLFGLDALKSVEIALPYKSLHFRLVSYVGVRSS